MRHLTIDTYVSRGTEWAILLDEDGHPIAGRMAIEDARAIQKAVNSHDDLVTALRNLVLRCDGEDGVRADGSNIDTCAAHAALARAEEA